MSRERCWECGTELKSASALSAHVGSRPCELAKVERRMAADGWKPCWVSDAGLVLNEAEIEHEKAPANYQKGQMASFEIRGASKVTRKKYFQRPHLSEAVWCPAWAQPIVELNIPSLKRIEILRYVKRNIVARVHAIGTVLALGGVEALALMASVPTEPNDDTEECESATQEARKPAS